MVTLARLAVVVVVLLLLARAARVAWRQRRLAVAVWRRIRPRHVLGSLGLLVAVLGTALTLLVAVPPTGFGLGSFVGLHGNAVFAPLEEALLRAEGGAPADPATTDPATPDRATTEAPTGSTPDESGIGEAGADRGTDAEASTAHAGEPPHPLVMLGTVGFLGGLVLLFPWLAYVEERVFRAGLERVGLGRELWTALKFGLLHMVMLIPLAAALAIAVAGFAYGRIYRRAYQRAKARTVTVEDAYGTPVVLHRPTGQLREEAVLESTVWHATFNSGVVGLVLLGFLADWFLLA